MSPRAVVTGATGFIGTAMVHALASAGVDVVATDRYAPHDALPVVDFVKVDLRQTYDWAHLMKGADTVYHLAALPSIARAPWDEYVAVNAVGTEQLARAALSAGVSRFVHMSSSTVYGIPGTCPIAETAPLQPSCHYSRSKLLAEQAVLRVGEEGLKSVIIRPRVVVGRGRAGIFALLFTLLRLNLPVPLVGAGSNRFQFTAIDDLIHACELAATAEVSASPIYNIGCEVTRPLAAELRELIEVAKSRSVLVPLPASGIRGLMRLAERFKVNPLVEEQYRIADVNFVLDTTHAKNELGFKARSANVAGLVEAWHWWSARSRQPISDLMRWWRPTSQNALQKREDRG